MKNKLSDVLLPTELHFFRSIALVLEPFLTLFQTSKPMFPFLHEFLEKVIRSVLQHFVKPNVLNEGTTMKKLASVNLSENSLIY